MTKQNSVAYLLSTWLLCLMSTATAAAADKPPASLPVDEMRAVVYTKAFAKRFALPDPEPGTEPTGGVQAMEFAVEPGAKHTGGRYYCKLRLYIDNKLSIAYPEEGVAGSDRMFIFPAHFFLWPDADNKRWLAMSIEDRKHFGEKQGRYNMMAYLVTPDYLWDKRGYGISMFYEEYHRDLFPGLSYIKINMGCPAYSWVDKVEAIQVWLRHDRALDKRKQLRTDAEDFVRFTVPQAFYRKITGWAKHVHTYNARILDEENAKRRNQQQLFGDGASRNISNSDTN